RHSRLCGTSAKGPKSEVAWQGEHVRRKRRFLSAGSNRSQHLRLGVPGLETEEAKMSRLVTTAILVAMISLGAMSRPVSAGGVTVMLSPHGDSADIIQQGLQIYAMIKEQKEKNKKKRKNHTRVDQKGHDNAVALSQKGNDNYGVIVQRGHDHTAT